MAENSEKSFPFDADPLPGSGLPDRRYLAEDWARYFRAFISSGTFLTEPTNLQVIANGDMTVTLKIGSMIIDGYRYDNIEDIIISVEPADGVLKRIDRVAITWSATDRDIHYTLQKGNMSYDPVAPKCRRSEEYKDYVVADIMVNAGIINISQTNIIDQRFNSEVCGLAVPFTEINTKNIFLQLQAFYDETVKNNALWQQEEKDKINEWFNNIKNQLSGDAAVNLQNQIGTLSSLTTDNKDDLVNAINELDEKKINASAILKTEEQVQANTNPDNVASAVVVGEVINNLGGCQLTQEGEDFYIVGADSVRKKLGSGNVNLLGTFSHSINGASYTFPRAVKHGIIASGGKGSSGSRFGAIASYTGVTIKTLADKTFAVEYTASAYEFTDAQAGAKVTFVVSAGGGYSVLEID